jgi:hypothetical protein
MLSKHRTVLDCHEVDNPINAQQEALTTPEEKQETNNQIKIDMGIVKFVIFAILFDLVFFGYFWLFG